MTIVTRTRDYGTSAAVTASCISNPMSDEPAFFPRGAIAFFVAMMALYAAIWLLLMGVMVSRG